MELYLRVLVVLGSLLCFLVNTLMNWFLPRAKPTYPPIKDKLLLKSVTQLVLELRQRKITSEQLVEAYIARIKAVNLDLNAVIEARFSDALKDAQHADKMIAKAKNAQMLALFARYPLLGVPFTVKESCGLKGLSFSIGNITRKNMKCPRDSDVVERLRAAGCIPLLVSANPEFCLSFETNTHLNGRCRNPYDLNRVSAGSSGGEGSLNGAGATPFGLSSDIGGSIRLPAMFCGVFGHKPTGGLLPVTGHFPYTDDGTFCNMLQMGPMTRFAQDLPVLLQIMAGNNIEKLKFEEPIVFKDIKIYYAYGYTGLNGWMRSSPDWEIKLAIKRAVMCFEKSGLTTKQINMDKFRNIDEISLRALTGIEGLPSITTQSLTNKPQKKTILVEFLKSLIGQSAYTKEALLFEFMTLAKLFIGEEKAAKLREEGKALQKELVQMLGNNGVLLFPTFHTAAYAFHTSVLNLVGVNLMLLANVFGLPATHIPMGLDQRGMPIGFQVIAAPYQDKLCLQIAAQLESAFGGWVPPLPHEVNAAD